MAELEWRETTEGEWHAEGCQFWIDDDWRHNAVWLRAGGNAHGDAPTFADPFSLTVDGAKALAQRLEAVLSGDPDDDDREFIGISIAKRERRWRS